MKKFFDKVLIAVMTLMMVSANMVFATNGSGDVLGNHELKESLQSFVGTLGGFSRPVGAFLVFIGVLMVGFNIIKNRDNADERTKSMESLLWLAIGAGIVGGALMISSFLWNTADDIDEHARLVNQIINFM